MINTLNFGLQSPGLDPRIYGANTKLKAKPNDLLNAVVSFQSTSMLYCFVSNWSVAT